MVGCKAQSFFLYLSFLCLLRHRREDTASQFLIASLVCLWIPPLASHLNLCYEGCSYCKQTGIVSYFNIPLQIRLRTRQKRAVRIRSPCFSLVRVAIETQLSKIPPAVRGRGAATRSRSSQPALHGAQSGEREAGRRSGAEKRRSEFPASILQCSSCRLKSSGLLGTKNPFLLSCS